MKDCCSSTYTNKEMKGGKTKMDKNLILWIIIGLLALLVIYAVFFKDTGAIANAGQAAQSASSGMVGGC